MMILLIDNYDSFTYNLYDLMAKQGQKIVVKQSHEITLEKVKKLNPSAIVISPGPFSPQEAHFSLSVIKYFSGKIPLLGVCLGHQCLAQVYGAKIIKAPEPIHGKLSRIHHNQTGLFKKVPQEFLATRYHSLVVDPKTLPDTLEVTAQTKDGIIMGLRHKKFKSVGVQFHPESILTQFGERLIQNFIKDARDNL